MNRPCRAVTTWVCAALGLAAACGASQSQAAPARRHATQSLKVEAGLGADYDTNVLQYSDSLLSAFTRGTRRDLFALHSTDDMTWMPSVALTWARTHRGGAGHSLRVSASGRYHAANGIADVTAWSARWRESFTATQRLSLGYFVMPNYYLRQLLDEDAVPPYARLTRYRPARFDLAIASAAWHTRLSRRTAFEAAYRREVRSYAPPFGERTSTLHGLEATLTTAGLPRNGSLECATGYAWSRARARDADDSVTVEPDDADVGYRGPLAHLTLRADLGHAGGITFRSDASLEVNNRLFTSSRAADTWHNGRRDVGWAEEVGVRIDPPGAWSLRAFYRHETNVARLGHAAPPSADAGDYTQNQIGATVTFAADVWKSHSPRSRTRPAATDLTP